MRGEVDGVEDPRDSCTHGWSSRPGCSAGSSEVLSVFTGIIEEVGSVEPREGSRLRISCSTVLDDVSVGDSMGVNGCCLTVAGWGVDGDRRTWWEAT